MRSWASNGSIKCWIRRENSFVLGRRASCVGHKTSQSCSHTNCDGLHLSHKNRGLEMSLRLCRVLLGGSKEGNRARRTQPLPPRDGSLVSLLLNCFWSKAVGSRNHYSAQITQKKKDLLEIQERKKTPSVGKKS